MNNPLPVDRFSVADAARRTWPHLIESMLEAVCLVEPEGLRIVAANGPAGRLLGVGAGRPGRPRHARARGHARGRVLLARGRRQREREHRLRLVRRPPRRRGGAGDAPGEPDRARARAPPSTSLALLDRSAEYEAGRHAAVVKAELQATLESVSDGVLVIDLAGHISHFNRRFAALWELPDEMLLLRADDEVFDWMRLQVAEPRDYMVRLAEIDAETMLEATDRFALRSGRLIERTTAPQCSRGVPIGRVFTFRERTDTPSRT